MDFGRPGKNDCKGIGEIAHYYIFTGDVKLSCLLSKEICIKVTFIVFTIHSYYICSYDLPRVIYLIKLTFIK